MGGLEKGKEISNFWEKVESTKDDRLVGRPLKKGNPDWKQNTLPLWLHGDGVEFQSRDSLMVWSFGSVLAEMQSLKSHMNPTPLCEELRVADRQMVENHVW